MHCINLQFSFSRCSNIYQQTFVLFVSVNLINFIEFEAHINVSIMADASICLAQYDILSQIDSRTSIHNRYVIVHHHIKNTIGRKSHIVDKKISAFSFFTGNYLSTEFQNLKYIVIVLDRYGGIEVDYGAFKGWLVVQILKIFR